ncbi:hypothetical protein EMIT053CA3_60123 [Pseudomonas donghuensis]
MFRLTRSNFSCARKTPSQAWLWFAWFISGIDSNVGTCNDGYRLDNMSCVTSLVCIGQKDIYCDAQEILTMGRNHQIGLKSADFSYCARV